MIMIINIIIDIISISFIILIAKIIVAKTFDQASQDRRAAGEENSFAK